MADGALIPLNFNNALLDRTADAATLFELFADGFEPLRMFWYAFYDGYGFAASAFGFAANSDNTIPRRGRLGAPAHASSNGPLTLRAQAPAIRTVYRPGRGCLGHMSVLMVVFQPIL